MTTFYCLRFVTPPTWRARSPYLYPPGTGSSSHWVPFSSSFSPYLTGNTLHLHYRDKPVNAVQGNKCRLLLSTIRNTVNRRYNWPGYKEFWYNVQNRAVYDCEYLEMLRRWEGFVVRKILKIKRFPNIKIFKQWHCVFLCTKNIRKVKI
jgi:hypothetical protein